jgi:TPR repeat protein
MSKIKLTKRSVIIVSAFVVLVATTQVGLVVGYYRGEEVNQDSQKAVHSYEKAAEQGEVDAQFNLGLMYYRG